MDGLKKRVSYVIHWVFVDKATSPDDDYYRMPYSLVFDKLDEKVAQKIKQIRLNPMLDWGPVVERIVHSELTVSEKKKLKGLLDG